MQSASSAQLVDESPPQKRRPAAADISARLEKAAALQKQGHMPEALAICQSIADDCPDDAGAHLLLGTINHRLGEYPAAYKSLGRSIAIDDANPETWLRYADCLYQLCHFESSETAYRRAVELAEDSEKYPAYLVAQVPALSMLGKSDEALAALHAALDLRPDYAFAHFLLGMEYLAQGDFAPAQEALLEAIHHNPELAQAYYGLTNLRPDEGLARALITRIETMLKADRLKEQNRCVLLFALGDLRHGLKEHDAAFEAYAAANAMEHERFPMSRESLVKRIDATIEGFTKETFEKLRAAGNEDTAPVFVVGMPRSGTTLTEQIIAGHPDAHGAGELSTLQLITAELMQESEGRISYPREAGAISHKTLRRYAALYLQALKRGAPANAVRITDKLPTNFFNLGLVAALFPNASIVHCRRNPMDTCLSCYVQHFARNGRINFASDLGDLGFFYRQYERLMDHWRKILPMPILDVCYEEVVADTEKASREMAAYIGLEWTPDCLDFQDNDRSIKTSSHWQARQPVYTSSVARWRVYEKYLGPLKEALGETG